MLIEADAVRGRKLTSWPSFQTDLRNAGATWDDEPFFVDGNLTTSRKPADLPVFNQTIIEQFAGPERLETKSVWAKMTEKLSS